MKSFKESTLLAEATSKRKVVVVYGGGFQPFHAGHLSSYTQAKAKFHTPDFYVASSNDVKVRPIPFNDKKFLAQQAGVTDDFVQVVQPINPKEIMQKYDETKDVLILVRSERDPMKYTKKDGSPAYYQPFVSIDKCESFDTHAYIFVTKKHDFKVNGEVAFSGSQIRKMYSDADSAGRDSIIDALYPNATNKSKVKKLLDKYIGGGMNEELDAQFAEFGEEVQASSDYKVSKSGKKYPAHRIVMGKKDDAEEEKEKKEKKDDVKEALADAIKSKLKSTLKSAVGGALDSFSSASPVLQHAMKPVKKAVDKKLSEDAEIDEAVLSLSQRVKRGMQFRRMQTRIQRARMIAMRRFADSAHLKRRARRAARTALKKRFSSGSKYDTMAVGQKIAVDKKLEKMKPVVTKLATRLLPTVRKKEFGRTLSTTQVRKESIDIDSKFVDTFTEEANLNKLDQLIRYGLADKTIMTTIKSAMRKLGSGTTLSPSERAATEQLVTTLVDIVTSSDQLFRLTKSQLQKEDIVLRKSYIKEEFLYEDDAPESEEDAEIDGIHMAKIELSAIIEDADEILSMLDSAEEEPDAWVGSKISIACDYITTVRDFMEYYSEEDEGEEDESETEEDDDEDFGVEEAVMQMTRDELGESYDEIKSLFEEVDGLQKKSEKSNISYGVLKQVYDRGIESYRESGNRSMTESQWAYARVNLFITGGKTDSDLWEVHQNNKSFEQFSESLEYGTDAARMAYARATPGQSQEITMARYSAKDALDVINSANVQRLYKLYSEESCCDDCDEAELEEMQGVLWRVLKSEADGRYFVVKGYNKAMKMWKNKYGAGDFTKEADAKAKVAELNKDVSEEEILEANLSLWRYNKITGIWKLERSVTPETKDKWLEIFKKDSPGEDYVIASKKPSKKPIKESEEILEEVDWNSILQEAEYQGKEVKLNKPFYTPGGPKKSAVYTMGPNGKVVIVRFGDPNMEIKKDNPERRKSFRARHNCSEPGPKWSAKYWSCKAW